MSQLLKKHYAINLKQHSLIFSDQKSDQESRLITKVSISKKQMFKLNLKGGDVMLEGSHWCSILPMELKVQVSQVLAKENMVKGWLLIDHPE